MLLTKFLAVQQGPGFAVGEGVTLLVVSALGLTRLRREGPSATLWGNATCKWVRFPEKVFSVGGRRPRLHQVRSQSRFAPSTQTPHKWLCLACVCIIDTGSMVIIEWPINGSIDSCAGNHILSGVEGCCAAVCIVQVFIG